MKKTSVDVIFFPKDRTLIQVVDVNGDLYARYYQWAKEAAKDVRRILSGGGRIRLGRKPSPEKKLCLGKKLCL